MDTANKKVKDISGSGIDAQQKGNVEVAEGKDGGNGISRTEKSVVMSNFPVT